MPQSQPSAGGLPPRRDRALRAVARVALLLLVGALAPLSVSDRASAAKVGSTPAASAMPTSLTAKQLAAIRSLIRGKMAARRAPGATFAIGLGDRVVWSEGFGEADVENHVPATPETRYRSASIGKAMTATAAMRLVEQGRLDLDVPIQKYCAAFPPKPWPITARHLITHTSGIRHYEGPNAEAEAFNVKHFDHVSDAMESFKDDSLVMPPGEDFHYTTMGYVVLGCVLEGATNEEYRALMKRLIFDPSGMTETRDDDPRALIPHRARGYLLRDSILTNSRWSDMSSKMAAGGWLTTASDLVRFMNSCMAGRLVSRTTLDLMLEPARLNHGTVDQYGMGWFIDDYHGMKAGTHGGGTAQVAGVTFFVPEKRLSIAGLFNLENISGPERIALAEAIADVVLGERTPNPDHFTPH